ncbi:VapC toxin family PIN domain ribonuclease [Actinophytocola xinjiangensis]|uniref:Ribonuclease VapC n=1 Tax=Actinophytocola xinjiangensis TaxID=485602 RepID=A0A7Z0WJM4_9PSEU|nr:type II toxin-antitoxin system VapC family toxin [Actinophytocola xinjiangensis]OLF08810.1 VapC toxin family PIN domain ribonuclease [Actinophytocola xinjiangensis]
MIVLDTNVVSELMRRSPDPEVVAWIDRVPAEDVYLTAVTAAELRYGVERLPAGARRTTMTTRVDGLLTEDFRDQILPFGADEAAHYAWIVTARERAGRPIGLADAQIAAICRRHGASLATRNVKDFSGTRVVLYDPWSA